MIRRPPRSTRTDTLFPYTTLFRSLGWAIGISSRCKYRVVHLDDFQTVACRAIDNHAGNSTLSAGCHHYGAHQRRVQIALAVDHKNISWLSQRSEEHTSELQSLMRISYAVFCLKKKTNTKHNARHRHLQTYKR